MRRLFAVVLVVALMGSACSKDKNVTPTPSGGSSAPSSSAPPLSLAKGVYGWDAYGIEAVLTPGTDTWTLEIQNKTGAKIDQPGIYALASDDGHRVDATLVGAKPLADGESGTLDVSWPPDFDSKGNMGMVMLMIGSELYGGFERGR